MLWMMLSGICVPYLLFRKIGQGQTDKGRRDTDRGELLSLRSSQVSTEGVMAGNEICQGRLWLIAALRCKEKQFMVVLSWNGNFMQVDLQKAVL